MPPCSLDLDAYLLLAILSCEPSLGFRHLQEFSQEALPHNYEALPHNHVQWLEHSAGMWDTPSSGPHPLRGAKGFEEGSALSDVYTNH